MPVTRHPSEMTVSLQCRDLASAMLQGLEERVRGLQASGEAASGAVSELARQLPMIRLQERTAHQVYRPRSSFTICGVRTRGLKSITLVDFLLASNRYELCRHCWIAPILALAHPAVRRATRAMNEEMKNDE